jgi:hypothetical protein
VDLSRGYLIEARSIGGLSGSSVFLHLSDTRIKERNGAKIWRNQISFHLLGLVHGHWDMPEARTDDILEDSMQNERLNVGIAIVVPATRIAEVINHPLLIAQREQNIEQWRRNGAPTPD